MERAVELADEELENVTGGTAQASGMQSWNKDWVY
jgi:hypothetical protein